MFSVLRPLTEDFRVQTLQQAELGSRGASTPPIRSKPFCGVYVWKDVLNERKDKGRQRLLFEFEVIETFVAIVQ